MRSLTGFWNKFIKVASVFLAIFQLYTAGFGTRADFIQRSVHLAFVMTMVFLLKPAFKKLQNQEHIPFYDIVLAGLSATCCLYIFFTWEKFLWDPLIWMSTIDKVFAVVFILLLLEVSRRAVGPIFIAMGGCLFLYAVFGPYFPGDWAHKGFSIDYIFQTFYHTTNGAWGSMIGISAGMLAAFAIFGGMLDATDGANTFINLGKKFASGSTGGPGKIAVVASGLLGMISGSAQGNVVATGTFTIPFMKESGYSNEWAAAIEADASTGGQIMPPIMGVGAFVMAQLLGISYLTIAKAAIVPAILYYIGIFVAIHFLAKRRKIGGRKLNPTIRLVEYFIIFIPLIMFVFFIANGYSVTHAAFRATIAGVLTRVIIFIFFEKDARGAPKKTVHLLYNISQKSAKNIMEMGSLLCGAQITITLISMTGFGVKLSEYIVRVGQNNLFLCLLLSMVVCIILGMGVPTTAAYVLGAAVLAPPLILLGMDSLVAHLFVFYFACLSQITPPVCAAVFVASGLAKANWWKTGWLSVFLALPCFVVPFTFAYDPALLLMGNLPQVVYAVITAVLGAFCLGIGVAGFFVRKLTICVRIFMFACGLVLVIPSTLWSTIGVLVAAILLGMEILRKKRSGIQSANGGLDEPCPTLEEA